MINVRMLRMWSTLLLDSWFLNLGYWVTNLPRNSTQGEQQHVVGVEPLVTRRDGADPVSALHGHGFDGLVHPSIRDADHLVGQNGVLKNSDGDRKTQKFVTDDDI